MASFIFRGDAWPHLASSFPPSIPFSYRARARPTRFNLAPRSRPRSSSCCCRRWRSSPPLSRRTKNLCRLISLSTLYSRSPRAQQQLERHNNRRGQSRYTRTTTTTGGVRAVTHTPPQQQAAPEPLHVIEAVVTLSMPHHNNRRRQSRYT